MLLKQSRTQLLLAIGLLLLLTLPSYAATSSTNTINYQMIIGSGLVVVCPGATTGAPVDLGTYNAGSTPTGTNLSCTITQNRNNGVMTITASPAANSITLTDGGTPADTITVNFSGYSYTVGGGGTLTGGGSFASGLSITNPRRGNSNFNYTATPAGIPNNKASGTYTGNHTLTFSLI